MGGAAKRRKKKKEAARKQQAAAAPSATPEQSLAKNVVKQEGGIANMPRLSEITAAPSEDTADERSLDEEYHSDEYMLDEVAKVTEEPVEDQNDLIFDVSLNDGPATSAGEVTEEQGSTTEEPVEEAIVEITSREIINPVPKVDVIPVSQSIYGTAKNVWSFGTHVPLLNLWMGVTHHVAEKVVGVVGQELESVDKGIETKLAELDFHVSRVLGR